MARRTTFCPVSENLSVIEPRSITVFHSNLDTSSIHGSMGRSYRLLASALILIDRVDSTPAPGAIFLRCAGQLRKIDVRVSRLSERHLHVKAAKTSPWRLAPGAWRLAKTISKKPTTRRQAPATLIITFA